MSRSGSEIVSWGVTLSGDWVTSGMGALSGVWVGDMGALTPFHKSDTWKESSPSCRFSWCDDARWVAGATECEIDTYVHRFSRCDAVPWAMAATECE